MSYRHIGAFGGTGSGNGLFSENPIPQRLAVYDATGQVFVADRGNNRIQVFSPSETGAVFGFKITATRPAALAVDQASGALYVANEPAGGVEEGVVRYLPNDATAPTEYTVDSSFAAPQKGNGPGEFNKLINGDTRHPVAGGLAVDPTNGDLLVADIGKKMVHRYHPDGTFVRSITGCGDVPLSPGTCASTERPQFVNLFDIAVDGNGDLITADVLSGGNGRIDRYDADGVHQATLSANNDPVVNKQLKSAGGITLAASPTGTGVFVSSVLMEGISAFPASRIYQFEDDAYVRDFTADGAPEATFSGLIPGIAVGGSVTHRLYVLGGALIPIFGQGGPFKVQAFVGLEPPTLTIEPAGAVSETSVQLRGTVNPHGESGAHWTFEYRPVGAASWQSSPAPPEEVDPVSTAETVEWTVPGLEPNTDYEARLTVTAGAASVRTDPVTFKTKMAPPDVDTDSASFLSDTGATLVGGVNPRNAETTYQFEWGESTAYGKSAPATPVSVGSGGTRVVVTAPLVGLAPNTTYHYRIVATNSGSQSEVGDDAVFTTLATEPGGLQGARGFELASSQPVGVSLLAQTGEVSADGESVMYEYGETDVTLPGTSTPHKVVLGRRGDSGWSFRPLDRPDPGHMFFSQAVYPSENMDSFFLVNNDRGVREGWDEDDQNGVGDLYLERPGQSYLWISRNDWQPVGGPDVDPAESAQTDPASSGQVGVAGGGAADAISADGAAVVFMSNRRLAEADKNASAATEDVRRGASSRLYKWNRGTLSLLSERADHSQPTGAAVTLGSSISAGSVVNSAHAVSDDGSRVFWSDGSTIYQQVDGAPTRAVGTGMYVDGSLDGSRLFFIDGGRLYRRDVASPAPRDLTGDAQVQGAVAVAENGERVYFVARAALAAEPSPLGARPVDGQNNLYVMRLDDSGAPAGLRLVARLGSAATDGAIWAFRMSEHPAATNRDGSVLAFGTASELTGQDTAGAQQAFVYDDQAGSLVCASCRADGVAPFPSSVDATLNRIGEAPGASSGWGAKRPVAEDGTVFFDTRTPLSEDDRNESRDVYEYRNGHLRLLTTGRSGEGAAGFVGASSDGSTVVVAAPTAFTAQDYEPGLYKFWALRVGGGFSAPEPAPECAGQGCEGAATPAPASPEIGSTSFAGRGNVAPGPAPLRLSVAGKRARVVTGAAAKLRVRVPGAGRVSVSGTSVRRAGKRVSKAGVYTIRVKLTPRAHRMVKKRKKGVVVRARVSYRASGGQSASRVVKLTFKQPGTRSAKTKKGGR